MENKLIKSILEEILSYYNITDAELIFSEKSDDNENKKTLHIKKVTAHLLKEVGRLPIKDLSNFFGESIIEVRKCYLHGINRRVISDINKLSEKIRKKNAVKRKSRRINR